MYSVSAIEHVQEPLSFYFRNEGRSSNAVSAQKTNLPNAGTFHAVFGTVGMLRAYLGAVAIDLNGTETHEASVEDPATLKFMAGDDTMHVT